MRVGGNVCTARKGVRVCGVKNVLRTAEDKKSWRKMGGGGGGFRKKIHFSSLCTYFENEKLLVLAGTVDCAKDSDSYDDDDEIQDHSTQMCLTETDTTSTRSSCSDESHASIYGKLSSTLY